LDTRVVRSVVSKESTGQPASVLCICYIYFLRQVAAHRLVCRFRKLFLAFGRGARLRITTRHCRDHPRALRYTSVSPAAATGTAAPQGGFRRFWRALKQLFHEAVGAIFGILAFAWLNNAFRAWTRDVAHWLVVVAILMAAIFILFSVFSFRRARKI